MADDDAGRPADSLVIAGLVPLSTVDWPGRLCATVFLQGCPWNCPYCHNHALIPTRVPGIVDWQEVRDLLSRRRGLLDGVRHVEHAIDGIGLAGPGPRVGSSHEVGHGALSYGLGAKPGEAG